MSTLAEHRLGRRIRELRTSRDMTLQSLSEVAGLSRGMLSKIESASVSPSIATLSKLAEALDVPIGDLFHSGEDDAGAVYFPKSKRQKVQGRRSSANYMYELLTPGRKRRLMQPVVVSVEGKNYRFRLRDHSGEQFVFLLEGEMTYVIGQQEYNLEPGDVVYFDAKVPHGPKLEKQQQAKYLAIFSQ